MCSVRGCEGQLLRFGKVSGYSEWEVMIFEYGKFSGCSIDR